MAKILGVPDDYESVCVLPVGVAEEEPVRLVKKKFVERAWLHGFGNVSGYIGRVNMIYLAGPFFNDDELAAVRRAESILQNRRLDFYSPRLHDDREHEYQSPEWSRGTFNLDRDAIDRCSIVLAVYHGNYSDTGTAWECGYAYATGKPVIVVHTGDTSNLMIHESATANICMETLETYDFQNLPEIRYSGRIL